MVPAEVYAEEIPAGADRCPAHVHGLCERGLHGGKGRPGTGQGYYRRGVQAARAVHLGTEKGIARSGRGRARGRDHCPGTVDFAFVRAAAGTRGAFCRPVGVFAVGKSFGDGRLPWRFGGAAAGGDFGKGGDDR